MMSNQVWYCKCHFTSIWSTTLCGWRSSWHHLWQRYLHIIQKSHCVAFTHHLLLHLAAPLFWLVLISSPWNWSLCLLCNGSHQDLLGHVWQSERASGRAVHLLVHHTPGPAATSFNHPDRGTQPESDPGDCRLVHLQSADGCPAVCLVHHTS